MLFLIVLMKKVFLLRLRIIIYKKCSFYSPLSNMEVLRCWVGCRRSSVNFCNLNCQCDMMTVKGGLVATFWSIKVAE